MNQVGLLLDCGEIFLRPQSIAQTRPPGKILAPLPEKNNLLFMADEFREAWRQRVMPRFPKSFLFFLPMLLLMVGWFAEPAPKQGSTEPQPIDPLPQDSGAAGLQETLLRLRTTARLMQTVAHPDDEDGGMLTLESRGKSASVLLLTLNRGEGGQNKIGSNLFDVLGVLRTLELLAADRYYGVEQRFTRVADFGFSKNAGETFQKWQGHDIALGDMVRVIRTFRPDVLVARFSGTDRDGHGHHQASSILTREAFRAAADANKFPEQLKEGLLPWQAKKLYIGNVCGFGAQTCPAENYTVKLNTGEPTGSAGWACRTPNLLWKGCGTSFLRAQGAGQIDSGSRLSLYVLQTGGFRFCLQPTDNDGHEQDFFDGVSITQFTGDSRGPLRGQKNQKVPLAAAGVC